MKREMPNPFRGDAPRRPRPPDVGSDRKKIGFLVLLLLLVVGAMIATQFSGPKIVPDAGKETIRFEPPHGDPVQDPAPSPELEELEKAAMESLGTLKDGPEKIDKSGEGFLRFLYLFLKLPPKEVSGRVETGITATRLLEKPDEFRGKYVRLRGRLIQLYTEPLAVTTTTGTRDVYLGIMETRPDAKTVSFYLGERPVNAITGESMEFHTQQFEGQQLMRDWVQVEGIFLRVWTYEGEPHPNGKPRWISAPQLFVKNIQPTPPPRDRQDSHMSWALLIGGVFGVIVIIVLFGGWMSGKYSKDSMRMKMLEVKRKQNKNFFPPKKSSPDLLGEEVGTPEDPPPDAPR
jgi:hypothetical protein